MWWHSLCPISKHNEEASAQLESVAAEPRILLKFYRVRPKMGSFTLALGALTFLAFLSPAAMGEDPREEHNISSQYASMPIERIADEVIEMPESDLIVGTPEQEIYRMKNLLKYEVPAKNCDDNGQSILEEPIALLPLVGAAVKEIVRDVPEVWEDIALEKREKVLTRYASYFLINMEKNAFELRRFEYCLSERLDDLIPDQFSYSVATPGFKAQPMFSATRTCEATIRDLWNNANEKWSDMRIYLSLGKTEVGPLGLFGYKQIDNQPTHLFAEFPEMKELGMIEKMVAKQRYDQDTEQFEKIYEEIRCENDGSSFKARNFFKWRLAMKKHYFKRYFDILTLVPVTALMPKALTSKEFIGGDKSLSIDRLNEHDRLMLKGNFQKMSNLNCNIMREHINQSSVLNKLTESMNDRECKEGFNELAIQTALKDKDYGTLLPFAGYPEVAERYKAKHPEDANIMKAMVAHYENKFFWEEIAFAGVQVTGGIACAVGGKGALSWFGKRELKKQAAKKATKKTGGASMAKVMAICNFAFGLPFNYFFYSRANEIYDHHFDTFLSSNDVENNFLELNMLKGDRLGRTLEGVFFFIGTGIGGVSTIAKKYISNTVKTLRHSKQTGKNVSHEIVESSDDLLDEAGNVIKDIN